MGVLTPQHVVIPLTGVDESVDPKLLTSQKQGRIVNAESVKSGSFGLRPSFDWVVQHSFADPITGMFATKNSLVFTEGRHIWRYINGNFVFANSGSDFEIDTSNCTVVERSVFRDGAFRWDQCQIEDRVVQACVKVQRKPEDTSGDKKFYVVLTAKVVDVYGNVVLAETELSRVEQEEFAQGPCRSVGVAVEIICGAIRIFGQGLISWSGIGAWEYTYANNTITHMPIEPLIPSATGSDDTKSWDVCAFNSTHYFAVGASGASWRIHKFQHNNVLAASQLVTPTGAVSSLYPVVRYDGRFVYVVLSHRGGSFGRVTAYRFDTSLNLLASNMLVSRQLFIPGDYFYNLSFEIQDGVGYVSCFFNDQQNGGAPRYSGSFSLDTLAGNLSTSGDHNVPSASQIFHGGSIYQPAIIETNATFNTSFDEAAFVSAGVLLAHAKKFVAVYDVGKAPIRRALNKNKTFFLGVAPRSRLINGTWRIPVMTRQSSLVGFEDYWGCDEVQVTFDAPKTAVAIGEAMLLSGGYLTWLTSRSSELGFVQSPHLASSWPTSWPTGLLPEGTYRYNAYFEDVDDFGFLHRSSPGLYGSVPIFLPNNAVEFSYTSICATHRQGVARKICRAGLDGQYHIISQPSEYDDFPTSYLDTYADGAKGSLMYTSSGELEAVCPNSSAGVFQAGNRIWLTQNSRENLLFFSKILRNGYAPEFNEAFSFALRERVVAVAALGEQIIVFTENYTYLLAGGGPDDAGLNDNFSPLTQISAEFGCINAKSVVSFKEGVFFQSKQGICSVDLSHNVVYRGAEIEDTFSEDPNIVAAFVVQRKKHVRFVCATKTFIFNYFYGIWEGCWEIPGVQNSCVFQDRQYYYSGDRMYREADTNVGAQGFQTTIETAWLQPAAQSGWARLWSVIPLFDVTGRISLTVEVLHNYLDAVNESDARSVTPSENSLRYHVRQQKSSAFKIRIIAQQLEPDSNIIFSGIRLEYGVKKGHVKVPKTRRF